MTQEAFIQNFVLRYPRMYVRLISYNYKFSTPTLEKFGFLLAWDKTGLLGNTNINWTKALKLKFAKRLLCKQLEDSEQLYLTADNIDPNNVIVKLRNHSKYTLNDVDLDFIRKNQKSIRDWGLICKYYKGIDYFFVKEFEPFLKNIDIFRNPFIDWNDFKLIKKFITDHNLILCKAFWDKFMSDYINDLSIDLHLNSMSNLEKIAKIHWKSDSRLKDNTFKYLMGIYVLSEYEEQKISSGYYYSEIDIQQDRILKLDKTSKVIISDEYIIRSSFN